MTSRRFPSKVCDSACSRQDARDTPVRRALWFIESRLSHEVRLQDVALASGVSRFHLCRTFVAATGMPVMQYVRGRRLSEAARELAGGAADILTVAMNWGYGSHEAFTRAFSSQFDLTPESLRARGCLEGLPLTRPIIMNEVTIVPVAPPREAIGQPRLIAGLGESYTFETNLGIPALWQQFVPYLGNVRGQVDTDTYGVCCHSDREGNFRYIAGVEVSDLTGLPSEFSHAVLSTQKYAVFVHHGHVAGIRDTVYSIWNQYLPRSGYETLGSAPCAEAREPFIIGGERPTAERA